MNGNALGWLVNFSLSISYHSLTPFCDLVKILIEIGNEARVEASRGGKKRSSALVDP